MTNLTPPRHALEPGSRRTWSGHGARARRFLATLLVLAAFEGTACASDHLDSPTTVANPQVDIADVYAWTAPDGRHLNLAMTMQGHSFSDRAEYVLHVDSGKAFGHTTRSTLIACRFASATAVNCQLGRADTVSGDPTNAAGLEGRNHRFRVYAALRDDPFYNNIKGLVGAYQVANTAIKNGAAVDAGGCAHLDAAATKEIREQMTHTEGGPAQNFLGNWSVSAIVVSVDLSAVTQGGKLLAVWGSTSLAGKRIDRMARPFVENTLLGIAPFSPDDASGLLRQKFNSMDPGEAAQFVGELQKGLAFQDSLDGACGNQLLAETSEGPTRYRALSKVFADDRLWVNSASSTCTQFFAVELASLAGHDALKGDCGGRTPTYDAPNVWRSLLIAGTLTGVTDGLAQDEHPPSATEFPFLAPPDAHRVDH